MTFSSVPVVVKHIIMSVLIFGINEILFILFLCFISHNN